ncbi:MAG: hypothetical protein V1911_00055, partial [Candidatus Micrarchaeota archaeon]
MLDLWLIFYIIAFFGSVSFGYLIVRFSLPDVRMLPTQLKMGLAGFAGFIVFIISFIASSFVGGGAYMFMAMGMITLFVLAFLVIKSMLFSPKTMRVAVPVAKLASSPSPAPAVMPTQAPRSEYFESPESRRGQRPAKQAQKQPEKISAQHSFSFPSQEPRVGG